MVESYVEREDKFDVEPGFVLPGLGAADERVTEVAVAQHQLRSEYFDTDDRALLTAGLTLRRRSGSTDVGWQLKVPADVAREEIRSSDEGETVPAELAELLLGVRRGQSLRPIAVLDIVRDTTELLDAGGRRLAEVADDAVHASATGTGATASSWREVEVELGAAGDEAILANVGAGLRAAGARPSMSRSKLARALDVSTEEPDDLLQRYLLAQQRAILAGDLALRRGDDAVIHKTRVGIRRYRSTLRTFLDREAGRALDDELRWWAGVLGEVRDRQVMRKRLLAMVDELDDIEVLGPVRARIEVELDREQRQAFDQVQRLLGSEQYLSLLEQLNAFRLSVHPIPLKKLAKLVNRADAKAAARLERAGADPVQLHRARKAAKRARYAGELATPASGKIGKRAVKQAARNEALQDQLGEHQDSLVTSELLKRLGQIAGTTPGENGFTFGLLYERERQRAAEIRRKLG